MLLVHQSGTIDEMRTTTCTHNDTATHQVIGAMDAATPGHAPPVAPDDDTTNATARELMESPVPLAWSAAASMDRHARVEPASRTRAVPKQLKMPQLPDEEPQNGSPKQERDEMPPPPPVVAPRPRRLVSTSGMLRFHQEEVSAAAPQDVLELSQRRHFRPITLDRPDVELTSPPMRAMNPIRMDSRFQNMQRLDLTQDAPLQPFERPSARARPRPFPIG